MMMTNKPLEWISHHKLLSTQRQALCLPLKGSVSWICDYS